MPQAVFLEWEGKEYDHSPKSADWYWALGIIATAAAIAAVIFGEYLVVVLIIIAASVIALHAAKEPPVHQFRLIEQGLLVGEELHPFERMISFSVLEDIAGELPPMLSIKNESWLSPHLVVPLADVDADAVYAYFLERVDEAEHRHSLVDALASRLGF